MLALPAPPKAVALIEGIQTSKRREEAEILRCLLARAIAVDQEDFPARKLDQLIMIGMGMYLAPEFERRASELADEVRLQIDFFPLWTVRRKTMSIRKNDCTFAVAGCTGQCEKCEAASCECVHRFGDDNLEDYPEPEGAMLSCVMK